MLTATAVSSLSTSTSNSMRADGERKLEDLPCVRTFHRKDRVIGRIWLWYILRSLDGAAQYHPGIAPLWPPNYRAYEMLPSRVGSESLKPRSKDFRLLIHLAISSLLLASVSPQHRPHYGEPLDLLFWRTGRLGERHAGRRRWHRSLKAFYQRKHVPAKATQIKTAVR